MLSHRLRFARRSNPDGTHDSICERCLKTIATRDSQSDLSDFELRHHCTTEDLSRTLHEVGTGVLLKQIDAILKQTKSDEWPFAELENDRI